MPTSKTIILETAKIAINPSTIRSRNALLLSKELGLPIVDSVEGLSEYNPKEVDKILVVGASFNPRASEIGNFMLDNKGIEIFLLNNDYLWTSAGTYSGKHKTHKLTILSSVKEEDSKFKKYSEYHFLNINALISKMPNPILYKKYDLIYYGIWRKKRHRFLQKYFKQEDFYFSSSKKNLRQHAQLGGYKAIWCDKLDWTEGKESLNLFKYSLYVEDDFSNTHFTNLANRFFEGLFCNNVQFFDSSCKNTIKEAGIEFDDYFYVETYQELKEKISNCNFREALEFQQKSWLPYAFSEKEKTIDKLKKLLL